MRISVWQCAAEFVLEPLCHCRLQWPFPCPLSGVGHWGARSPAGSSWNLPGSASTKHGPSFLGHSSQPSPIPTLCARGSQARAAWNPSLPRLAGNRKKEEERSESWQPLPPLTSTTHPESVTQSVGAPHIRAHTHLLALTHICLAQMRSVSPQIWQMHRRFT